MSFQTPLSSELNRLAKSYSDCCQMTQQTAVNNALGTLLGYLGSEVAPPDIFERLLWPARSYAGFDISKIFKVICFMPMGGPLHKAALITLDKIHANGLLKGRSQGHMLGSPFYHDTSATYTVYDCKDPNLQDKELVRNGFWPQVIANLPIPHNSLQNRNYNSADSSKDSVAPSVANHRAIHRVSHLKLSIPTGKPPPAAQMVDGDVEPPSIKTYFALVISETTGIIVACAVLAIWKSWFMILWFLPLILKLTSAFFALDRHQLETPGSISQYQRGQSTRKTSSNDQCKKKDDNKPLLRPQQKKFEIHGLSHGFLIVEGDENLVIQFFRHYGHPIRNRLREYIQILIVIQFGFVFPIGILCSLLWMPLGIQYVWMGYQMYTILAMHVYRYAKGNTWATAEEQFALGFATAAARGEPQRMFLGGEQGVLMAELEVTYHSRYRDGRIHCDKLLYGNSPGFKGAETAGSAEKNSQILSIDGDSITKQEV